MEMSQPLIWCISLLSFSRRSVPSKTIWPSMVLPGGGIRRMMDRALALLLQPLSPTTASVFAPADAVRDTVDGLDDSALREEVRSRSRSSSSLATAVSRSFR